MLGCVLLGLAVPPAWACRVVKSNDINPHVVIPVLELQDPDLIVYAGGQVTNGLIFEDCPRGADLEVVTATSLAGVRYIRDITFDGLTFPAYGWSETSPLIAVQLYKHQAGAPPGTDNTPLRLNETNHFTVTTARNDSGAMYLTLSYLIFSRGGDMTGVQDVRLTASTILRAATPSGPFQHLHDFTLAIPGRTCQLSDTQLILPPIPAAELAEVGATSMPESLEIPMNCPRSGIPVTLTLTDALDAGNRGSVLTVPDVVDSRGVAIELLRNGSAVTFGQPWSHGPSVAGQQLIPLEVRYRRLPAHLVPGDIEGLATLTADYR